MSRISLLLADKENEYQQLLCAALVEVAPSFGHELLPPQFADGLGMAQGEHLLSLLRSEPRADVAMITLVAPDLMRPVIKIVLGAGIGVVFLNRIPEYFEDLRHDHPRELVAAVAPDQRGLGVIQAAQCIALAPQGGFALLITGSLKTPSARQRTAGFRSAIGRNVDVHEIEGHWNVELARKGVSDWLRMGTDRSREVNVIVGQNDRMAMAARQAFEAKGREMPPAIGCDGLPAGGQQMVRRGDLAATVIVPPTTPAAVDVANAFWRGASVPAITVLDSIAFPQPKELRRK